MRLINKKTLLKSVALAIGIVGLVAGCSSSEQPTIEPQTRAQNSKTTKTGTSKDNCLNLINGTATSDFPSVVLLARVEGGNVRSSCTGTFVSPTTIITAAH